MAISTKLSAAETKSVSDRRLLTLTLTVCLIAAMFGKPLPGAGGKLAISNVAQILIFALLFFRTPRFTVSQHGLAILILATSLVASCYTYLTYGLFGKPIIVMFVILSIGFVFMMCNLFDVSAFDYADMRRAIRPAMYIVAVLYIFVIIEEIAVGDGVSLGMDDKSHASIYLGFLSFLSLRFLGRERFVFAVYFLFLSLFSISRLAFVFAPFISAMILLLIVREGSFVTKVRTGLVLAILIALAVWFIQNNPDYFKVLDRVSSADEIAGSNSSIAHKLLLVMGIELKFHDVGLFLLGTSPGSFADILLRSGIDYSALASLDPAFIMTAWQGKAPIHSTHMAILVEYSIVIFILYVAYIVSILWRAWRLHEYILILFLLPYLLSVLFYSAHNKFYFFVVAAVVEITLRMSKRYGQNPRRAPAATIPRTALPMHRAPPAHLA